MTQELIVVGAGHGGLIAAAHLAKHGYHVQIYEQYPEEGLGYDWYDDFHLDVFEKVGIPKPKPLEYNSMPNWSFLSPLLTAEITLTLPEDIREIMFERKPLYQKLIAFARDSGVEFHFKTKVVGPFIENNIITGIKLENTVVRAALVIDAAGIDSPIRTQLPASYKIQNTIGSGERFYAFRGFYSVNNLHDTDPKPKKIILDFNNQLGISWFRRIRDFCDVFFGKIEPFTAGEVELLFAKLKTVFPQLGDTKLRGGQYALIPVRHPLELFVGNHYVAIGDSACMNIPINGSGIENAMLAGKILAEELLKIGVTDYSIEKLWSYQYRYYQEIGAKMTSLDIIKYFLFSVTPAEVNYIIERKLLKATDFETSLLGKELKIEVSDLLGRLARGFSRLDLLLSLKIAVDSSTTVLAIAQAIPEKYDEKTWQDWSQKIIKQFAPYKKKIKN